MWKDARVNDARVNEGHAGTWETEVRLYGWCEGGLVQQRNDGGGCATMRQRPERVERASSLVHM